MFSSFFSTMQAFAHAYGAWGIAGLDFFQEICPFFPSTLVSFSGGALFLAGQAVSWGALRELFFGVALPSAAGLTAGASVVYGLAYRYGKGAVDRFGKYVGVTWSEIERLRAYFSGHALDEVFFFMARSIPLVPSILLGVFAGAVRWRFASFVILTFLGTVVRSLLIGFIGWQLGSVYERYAAFFDRIEIIGGIAVLAVIAGYLYHHLHIKKQSAIIEP